MIQPSDVKPSSGAGGRARPAKGRFRSVIPACILFAHAAAAFGQETPRPPVTRLSPHEAVELAIKNNLGLEASRVDAEVRKRKSDTSWNVFIPTVDLAGNLVRTNAAASVSGTTPFLGQPLAVSPLAGNIYGVVPYSVDVPQWSVSGSLSVAFNFNFALFEAMKNLRLEYEAGLVSYAAAKVQLERDVRKSYYQMLLLEENIALLRESFATAQRRVEMARANYEAGLVPELTWLQARVAMENLKPTIDEAEKGLKVSMASFAMNLGLPYDTQFELSPLEGDIDFIPLDTAELIAKAASGKPEIQEIRQQILITESGKKAQTYKMYTPNLQLAWNADPTFQGDPWKDSWVMKDGWKQRSGMFRITLAFSLNNLLPFGTEAQARKNLDDGLRTLNIRLAQAVRGTELEIYNTILQLEKARITIEAQELTADLAERTYRLTEEAYRAGLNELLEVQNAELELRKARIGVLEQGFNYLMGLLDLEYAAGMPFGTLGADGSIK
jgi:outer membrane protein TolC